MAALMRFLALSLVLFGVAGCTPKTIYTWTGYDDALYNHYKNPTENEAFIEALKEVVEEGEKSGRIPPGIYAEYGYTLYEQGKIAEAVIYFKKESEKWPDSKIFMNKVIAMSNNRQKKQDKKDTPSISSEVKKDAVQYGGEMK